MHHKRKRPKNRRAGCLMCKPHKANGAKKLIKIKGIKGKIDLHMVPSFSGKDFGLLNQ